MERNERYADIFKASHQLFLTAGYEAATIRQISDQAGVSLGLTNHFFKSKQNLAGLVLDMVSAFCGRYCERHPEYSQPLFGSALRTRVVTLYLMKSRYRRFYAEALKDDVPFHRLAGEADRSLYQLAALYGFPVDDDLFLLYGNYVPYHCQKTLILGKERGMFATISWEEIPDYILISKLEHFLDSRLLRQTLDRTRSEAEQILASIPGRVPDHVLLDFLDTL